MNSLWRSWKFKNATFLIIALILFFYFAESDFIQSTISAMGSLGYFGSMTAGIFFVSIFTAVPASVIIFDMSKQFNPLLVAITAGAGAVIGDYLVFRFLKDSVFEELSPIFKKSRRSFMGKIFASATFSWIVPVIGALIIALPIPDEIGITMMGLSKIKIWQFVLVTFLLNSVGIFVIVTLAGSI